MDTISSTQQQICDNKDAPAVAHADAVKADKCKPCRLAMRIASHLGQFISNVLSDRNDFDNMSEAQLRDLGIHRVSRREHWVDGIQSQFARDHSYRHDR